MPAAPVSACQQHLYLHASSTSICMPAAPGSACQQHQYLHALIPAALLKQYINEEINLFFFLTVKYL